MTAEEIKKVIRRAFTRHMVQHVQVARGDVRDRVDLFIDEATDELLTEFASQKDASKADNGLFFGQNVIASNYKDFDPYWKAIYISKHPTENSHIVILPARPDLNLEESTSIFEFVKPND